MAESHRQMPVVARAKEIALLRKIIASSRPELVAIYGRRRVGKTYLIENEIGRNMRKGDVFFTWTGDMDEQTGQPQAESELIFNLRASIIRYLGDDPKFGNLEDVFLWLARLARDCSQNKKTLFIFLDEFPWLCATRGKSIDFFNAFKNCWNNILNPMGAKVFLCGSATSWMLRNLVHAKGGFAKRLTHKIKLNPFNLKQTREYLAHRGITYSYRTIIELHMIMGGIPWYLDMLDPGKSLRENLYAIMVDENGLLAGKSEYEDLFRYLFAEPDYYQKLVELFNDRRHGLGLAKIAEAMEGAAKPSRKLQVALKTLTESNILDKRVQFKNISKGTYYFLTDEYIRFYNKWLNNKQYGNAAGFYRIFDSQSYRSWNGYNFENLCIKHIEELKNAMGISGIAASHHMYYSPGVCQIDILIDRADKMVTICEAKYHDSEYVMSAGDYKKMIARRDELDHYLKAKRISGTDFNFCLIHLAGVKRRNKYIEQLSPIIISAGSYFE